MPERRNAAPGTSGNGASDLVKAGQRDYPKNTTPENQIQVDGRFRNPVKLHFAGTRVIERLARQHAISVTHAATVADLAGIGGRRR